MPAIKAHGTLKAMKIDHAEFIARHHKTPDSPPIPAPDKRDYTGLLVMVTMLCFGGVLLFIGVTETLSIAARTIASIAFVTASLVTLIVFRYYRRHAVEERELDLVRRIMEGSRGARLITDSADNTIYYNRNFEQMCRGVGQPGFKTLVRLFQNNDEAKSHFAALADQAHRGLTDSIELFSKFEDRERWLAVSAQPIPGRAGFIHWRIDDVTDKYVIDQAIREEREKLIDFTDNAPVGFFSVNESGRFVFANATFARWLGEDLKFILDQATLHTYLVDPPKDAAPYDLIPDGRARQIVEIQMKGTGGKTFLASVNQVVVREKDEHGTPRIRTRAVVHDLTAERELSLALKASEDRFQRFFEEAPVGIMLIDDKAVIADCNNTLAAVLGDQATLIEGQNLRDLMDEAEFNTAIPQIRKIDKGEQLDAPLEVTLRWKSRIIQTQMHARRFRKDGRIVLHFIDVTEQKQLEAQFVQSQKMQAIGQLAGGVAHDFNNLLTAIIGFCDLLMLRHKPGDPSFGDIMQIKQNSNRAANLVSQLLAFSRQQTLRPRVHDVAEILTEVSHLLRRLIGASIDLELIHGNDLKLVKVDKGQMDQVLVNLAVNARDAMGGTGQLTIETQSFSNKKPKELVAEDLPPGHWTVIKVTDTGCGISPENLSRIFEPFFTTKDVGEGTGLGLATVYGIIRQTDGYLDVQSQLASQDIKGGTSFIVYLPIASESDQAEETPGADRDTESDTRDLTGSERILLVEDEDAVRTFSQRALTNKGYEVLTAGSGENALEVFEKQEDKHLDLLITDVVMPGMDGPTLAQHMRQHSPSLKIIFMSGYTEDKLKDHMGEGIFFLPKPFTLKQLAARVKEVLEG
ncbi:MAG: response regulator [Bdellovibrionales bacterium]